MRHDEDRLNDTPPASVTHEAPPAQPAGDGRHDEPIGLVSGMNDVLAAIACVLFLVGGGAVLYGWATESPSVVVFVQMTLAWTLSEVFSRRRRARLTGLLLCVWWSAAGFVLGFVLWVTGATVTIERMMSEFGSQMWWLWLWALVTSQAHWLRFRIPITSALQAGVGIGLFVWTGLLFAPETTIEWMNVIVLLGGLACVWRGTWWDRVRAPQGRIADPPKHVGFWLHLVGAWMVVHPLFQWIGDLGGHWSLVLGFYAVLAAVALALDRRSLLVASLVYFVTAVSGMMEDVVGVYEARWEVSTLTVGTLLIALTVGWQSCRRVLMAGLERIHWSRRSLWLPKS